MNNDIQIVSDNHSSEHKRQYLTKETKQHLKTFEQIEFSDRELKHLGILREVVKPQYVEIISRANYEVIKTLRQNPQSIRIQDLAVISNMATQRLLELENAPEIPQKVDWSKISEESFSKPDTATGSVTPSK